MFAVGYASLRLRRYTMGRYRSTLRAAYGSPSPRPPRAPRPIETLIPLWSHWLSVTALVALVAIFWTGHKLNGVF